MVHSGQPNIPSRVENPTSNMLYLNSSDGLGPLVSTLPRRARAQGRLLACLLRETAALWEAPLAFIWRSVIITPRSKSLLQDLVFSPAHPNPHSRLNRGSRITSRVRNVLPKKNDISSDGREEISAWIFLDAAQQRWPWLLVDTGTKQIRMALALGECYTMEKAWNTLLRYVVACLALFSFPSLAQLLLLLLLYSVFCNYSISSSFPLSLPWNI